MPHTYLSSTTFVNMQATSRSLLHQGTRCLASATTSAASHNLGLTAAALLPPIPLYRRILRAHRKYLPADMRSLGDTYVRDEFRRHQKIDQPLQIVAFLGQWQNYSDELDQGQAGFRGRKLDMDRFAKLSDEQLYQLHEFMTAANELYDPEKAQAAPPGGAKAVQEAVDEALRRVHEDEQEEAAAAAQSTKG